MSQYLPSHPETIKKFLYENIHHHIIVNFENSNEEIPLFTYVEKKFDNNLNFTWYNLFIKLDIGIPDCDNVKITINHPTNPRGKTTFENMKTVAETTIKNVIPILLKKNYDKIKQYLSQNN